MATSPIVEATRIAVSVCASGNYVAGAIWRDHAAFNSPDGWRSGTTSESEYFAPSA